MHVLSADVEISMYVCVCVRVDLKRQTLLRIAYTRTKNKTSIFIDLIVVVC